ncbi:MAG: sigma-70 family RNA polymerase sigma factor, partial [Phycisphaerae bacterium]|nr:sigma-70 family RNA polymerase sigma factor [Phycisphaerae bacterium]
MAKYRLTAIAQLAHQLKLSPARLRLQQLAGAEHLLDLIEPEAGYPYEFVCFHITGYRPRTASGHGTLKGQHLVGDLVQLVEDLSGQPIIDAEVLPESVWSTEQLARRLGVSTKTICRWRRRGLAGRKLRFADGAVRVAFPERCIRRFVRRNLALVQRGAAFKQLTAAEKGHIVSRAQALLGERRMRLHELSQKIAGETGRAVETIRYTLRRYDAENPAQALFGKNEQPIMRPEHEALYEAYTAGASTKRLAMRFGMAATTVEQIIREIRARQLRAMPLEWIYAHEFDSPNADDVILADGAVAEGAEPAASPMLTRVPRDLPPYLQDLYRVALLTPRQERELFRRYNYLKFKAGTLRAAIDPLHVTDEQLVAVETLLAAADAAKARIIQANLRLVVSIARRHVGRSPEFFDVVSDGNLALMRAVEKFDYARGYKFSTYASWAIMRNFARTVPEARCRAGRQVFSSEELLATVPDTGAPVQDAMEREGLRQTLARGLAQLEDRERAILIRHFGLTPAGEGETLDQIGKVYGVT